MAYVSRRPPKIRTARFPGSCSRPRRVRRVPSHGLERFKRWFVYTLARGTDNRGQSFGGQSQGTERSSAASSEKSQIQTGKTDETTTNHSQWLENTRRAEVPVEALPGTPQAESSCLRIPHTQAPLRDPQARSSLRRIQRAQRRITISWMQRAALIAPP
jgi:hypothetical protein